MSFIIQGKELEYQRKSFDESLRLYGVKAKLYSAKEPEEIYDQYEDLNNPGTCAHETEPTNISLTFEETPAVKTLKQYGWFMPEQETLPILVYLPLVVEGTEIKPGYEDLLEIPSNIGTRKFIIKDFRGVGFPNVIYWICRVVPLEVDKK